MEQEAMDMQKLSFFTEGNVFTGSRTKDWSARTMLRYLVRPDKENEKLLAWCWKEDVCFELAQERQNAEFPLSEEGVQAVQDWLARQYALL